MEKEHMPQLSVVILCYRAGNLVPVFVSQMKKALEEKGILYELILVANYDSHSKVKDETPGIVSELAKNDPILKVVAREKQGMMGWDMRSGLNAASGDVVGVIDGDGQMPPEDVARTYEYLISSDFDIVKTYREERFDGPLRIFISGVYNALVKILFPRVNVRDVNSKPKTFRREALQQLKLQSDDWFLDTEMIIQASYLNLKIGEIPTKFHENKFRRTFIGPTSILQFAKNLLIYRIKIFFN